MEVLDSTLAVNTFAKYPSAKIPSVMAILHAVTVAEFTATSFFAESKALKHRISTMTLI